MKNSIFLILLFSILLYFLSKSQTDTFTELLNIYDETLIPCGTTNMSSGSWDSEGKCSELGGGVHQICIENISKKTPNFSQKTGQSNWSDQRGNNNHCVCLGAWSLYQRKNPQSRQDKVLKCEAIPKVALTTQYVSKFGQGWNKWNGLELPDQIKDGVESLVENCYTEKEEKSQKLQKNYCDFAREVEVLRKGDLYEKLC